MLTTPEKFKSQNKLEKIALALLQQCKDEKLSFDEFNYLIIIMKNKVATASMREKVMF